MGVGNCDGYIETDAFKEWLGKLDKLIIYGQGCMFVRDLYGILNYNPRITQELEKGFYLGITLDVACKYLDSIMQTKRREAFEWLSIVGGE